MFGNLGNLKNLGGILSQMGEMKEKFEALEGKLRDLRLEGEAGAGAVRVVINGKFEVAEVNIDPVMVGALAGEGSQADQLMVEDLIAAAMNMATDKARRAIQEEVQQVTGGLLPPGMERLMGG